jgi:SHS2 domain-containing protein
VAEYTVLSHTADTGIEARGATLGDLLGALAFGMFDVVYDLRDLAVAEPVSFEIEAADPAELAVDLLSELLYLSEADDVVLADVRVESDGTRAAVTAGACPAAGAELKGPPIKAVTYHDLVVRREPDGSWFARVIFDV